MLAFYVTMQYFYITLVGALNWLNIYLTGSV